ncbi:MAG: hypothetical protein LBQ86_01135 [Holophagales bacterium]|jgi:hypothetical protein|nr:hypothetical protein [Holophagales bacterium]
MEHETDLFSDFENLEKSLKQMTKIAIDKGIALEQDATLKALMATFVELKNDLQNSVEERATQTKRDGDL